MQMEVHQVASPPQRKQFIAFLHPVEGEQVRPQKVRSWWRGQQIRWHCPRCKGNKSRVDIYRVFEYSKHLRNLSFDWEQLSAGEKAVYNKYVSCVLLTSLNKRHLFMSIYILLDMSYVTIAQQKHWIWPSIAHSRWNWADPSDNPECNAIESTPCFARSCRSNLSR